MRKKIGLITMAAVLLISVFALSACSKKANPTRLTAPTNLQISETTLTWTAVANASSYKVDIDGTEHSASAATYDLSALTTAKTYTIKVKAIGNGTAYTDSDWSQAKSYVVSEQIAQPQQLPVPANHKIEGKYFSWDDVENATGYKVSLNDVEYNQSISSYWLGDLTTAGTYVLKVKAIGDGEAFTDSAWSSEKSYVINEQAERLAAPTGLAVNGFDLTWNPVTNADSYEIDFNNGVYSITKYAYETTTYSLAGQIGIGTYTIKIKAASDSVNYTDSDWSQGLSHEVTELKKLDAPTNLSVDNYNSLIWDGVIDGQNGYTVDVDGTEYTANTTMFSLSNFTDVKTYTIKVKAKGDSYYADSDWSSPYSYMVSAENKLDTPQNLSIDGNILSWGAVIGADTYTVYYNETLYATVFTQGVTTINLLEQAPYGLTPGTYNVSVVARSLTAGVIASNKSATVEYVYAPPQLDTPQNIELSDTELSWNAVENAYRYRIYFDAENSVTTFGTSYNLSDGISYLSLSAGTYSITVVAETSVGTRANSDPSAAVQFTYAPDVQPTMLDMPTGLQVSSSGFFEWDSVPGNNGYTVMINNIERTATYTFYSISSLSPGTYTLYVKANGDGINYYDSEWAEYEYTAVAKTKLDTPQNVELNGTVLSWDSVDNASGYYVYVYLGDTMKVMLMPQTNSIDISDASTQMSDSGTYRLVVCAYGSAALYETSDMSDSEYYTVKGVLAEDGNYDNPTALTIDSAYTHNATNDGETGMHFAFTVDTEGRYYIIVLPSIVGGNMGVQLYKIDGNGAAEFVTGTSTNSGYIKMESTLPVGDYRLRILHETAGTFTYTVGVTTSTDFLADWRNDPPTNAATLNAVLNILQEYHFVTDYLTPDYYDLFVAGLPISSADEIIGALYGGLNPEDSGLLVLYFDENVIITDADVLAFGEMFASSQNKTLDEYTYSIKGNILIVDYTLI